jgi:hypothetical protein
MIVLLVWARMRDPKLPLQAGKLSAKQEESDIKSVGARNDYLLALETSNAHQDRLEEVHCTAALHCTALHCTAPGDGEVSRPN